MLKSYRVGWWGGGPCDYCVSPSPLGLDFGTLDFGTSDSGLTISEILFKVAIVFAAFIQNCSTRGVGKTIPTINIQDEDSDPDFYDLWNILRPNGP